ncbi:YbbR-like domain-containing protein [Sediminicola luteus]|uniref:YbbR-like domain-containing protein n=1 Tax=Sediminicola luteus TaxID=319238 RepID=A0A2A4G7E5_9FLAO|nr:YbbR-like domain-containing protein [Sediminicola luteus]PCE63675.1 hypothetical protein B7P33_10340 [Sediminicola luteus]
MQAAFEHQRKQRRIKVFLFFLSLSLLSWFVNKLSGSYIGKLEVPVTYTQLADTLLLTQPLPEKIQLSLNSGGFYLLGQQIHTNAKEISLNRLQKNPKGHYITRQELKRQLALQLPNDTGLRELFLNDTLYVQVSPLAVKEVPVVLDLNLELGSDFMLQDSVTISPAQIRVVGPISSLDTIRQIASEPLELKQIQKGFDLEASLILPKLLNTQYDPMQVRVRGEVIRFSEKIIQVPVTITQLPPDIQIRTFPETVSILCRDRIDKIRDLTASDFLVSAPFPEGDEKNTLALQIGKKPTDIHTVLLLEEEVHYIIRKE